MLKILLALCLATPILAFSGVIFPYTSPKVFVFRTLVEIAAVFYLYLALKYPANFFTPFFKKGVRGILSLSVLVFLIISLFSAIFGADFYNSFWGNLERGIGFFGLLHFIVSFFLLSAVFSIDSDKNKTPPFLKARFAKAPARRGGWEGFKDQSFSYQLIIVSVSVSTLISLLAIFQYFFSLGNLLPQVDRVYSLIGNPAFLGTYLIFNIFLAGYLFFIFDGKEKWFFAISNLLLAIGLFLTGTRGAWLGLLAGVIVFLIILAIRSFYSTDVILSPIQRGEESFCHGFNRFFVSLRSTQNDKKESSHPDPAVAGEGFGRFVKKLSLFFLIAIVIVIGLLFSFRNSSFIKSSPALSRLTSISLSDTTAQARLILWQGAWQAWQARPFLGFGLENFEIAVNKYSSPRLASFESYAADRAHNFIFDYGVAGGWFGFLGYLGIFGAAGFYLFKIFKEDFYFFAIFGSLLIAYLVQNFFVFDSFVSYLMLFFVLALIAGYNLTTSQVVRLNEKQKNPLFKGSASLSRKRGEGRGEGYFPFYKKLILLFAISYSLFAIYSFNLKPLLAANYANQILSLPANEAVKAGPLLQNILALNSFASGEIIYQTTLDYIEKISQNPALAQNEEFYNITSEKLSKIIERSPNQYKNYIALSWLDLYFSGQAGTRIEQSLQLAQKVRELSPNKKDAYLLLVAGYSLSAQPQKVAQVVDQATAIDGKMGEEVRDYFNKLK